MLVCPKCSIEYEEGKKFCRKCGSFLLSEEGSTFELPITDSTELGKKGGNLFCPKCQESYRKGKYCRKCGSLLAWEIPSQEHRDQIFEKKPLRSMGKVRVITAIVVILLIIMGVYSFRQKHEQTSQSMTSPLQNPGSLIQAKEAEKIQSLFEKVREANLKKNIDLFMSCYSLEFKDRRRKRLDALENWKHFHYVDLTYHLMEQTITGDTANARVEWLMKISKEGTGKPEDIRTVLDIVLEKEGEDWKIKDINP